MTTRLRTWTRRISPRGVGCSCGALFLAVIVAIALLVIERCRPADEGVEADAAPRLLLNRVWFDKLPKRDTDSIDLWIFLSGGVALHENGSRYRGAFDFLDFERQGAKLDGKYLHDKKAFKTSFSVRSCTENPPFDLCLTLDDVDGKKVELYGFGSDEDMEQEAPRAKGFLAAAKARGSYVGGSK